MAIITGSLSSSLEPLRCPSIWLALSDSQHAVLCEGCFLPVAPPIPSQQFPNYDFDCAAFLVASRLSPVPGRRVILLKFFRFMKLPSALDHSNIATVRSPLLGVPQGPHVSLVFVFVPHLCFWPHGRSLLRGTTVNAKRYHR